MSSGSICTPVSDSFMLNFGFAARVSRPTLPAILPWYRSAAIGFRLMSPSFALTTTLSWVSVAFAILSLPTVSTPLRFGATAVLPTGTPSFVPLAA